MGLINGTWQMRKNSEQLRWSKADPLLVLWLIMLMGVAGSTVF